MPKPPGRRPLRACSAPEVLKYRRSGPEGGTNLMYKVYLLKSKKDFKYYVGQTDNIERRLEEHNSGKNKSTKNRRPFFLVGCEEYETQNEARYREYQLKNHSDKKKKFIEKLEKDYDSNKKNLE
jgi:putative endonuclease